CPGLENERKRLLESFVGLRHRNTKASEFVVAVAFADPEFEPAVGHQGDRRPLFRAQPRVIPRQYDYPRAPPPGRCARRHPRQEVKACGYLSKSREVMLNHEGAVKAKSLGLHVAVDEILETLRAICVRAPALRLGAAEKTKFHGAGPICFFLAISICHIFDSTTI